MVIIFIQELYVIGRSRSQNQICFVEFLPLEQLFNASHLSTLPWRYPMEGRRFTLTGNEARPAYFHELCEFQLVYAFYPGKHLLFFFAFYSVSVRYMNCQDK